MRFYPLITVVALAATTQAFAQQNGAPPADIGATVATPAAPGAPPPPPPKPLDTTNLELSAGGQLATGNSQTVAMTGQTKFGMQRGPNVFAASLLGNFAEALSTPTPVAGTPTAPGVWKESTENVQGKLRYERFFIPILAGFLQATGTHDSFQAVTFRLNIDPGVRLNIIANDTTKLWAEVGYDFQFDDNYVDGSNIELSGSGGQSLDKNGLPYVIMPTDTLHSTRAFVGFRHAFNKDVLVSLGLEYLQGIGGSNTGLPNIPAGYTDAQLDRVPLSVTGSRLNFDLLFTAHLINAFSLGVGFSAKYNSDPLAGKGTLDTATTLTLIYSLALPKPTPPPPPPPCTPSPCVKEPLPPLPQPTPTTTAPPPPPTDMTTPPANN